MDESKDTRKPREAPAVIIPAGNVHAKMTIDKKVYDFAGDTPGDCIAQASQKAKELGKNFKQGGGSKNGGVDDWEILQER